MDKLRMLLEQRMKLVTDMRGLLDKADTEKRSMTAEENTTYAAMEADLDKAEAAIEQRQKLIEKEGRKFDLPEGLLSQPTEGTEARGKKEAEQRSAAYRSFLVSGLQGITVEEKRALQADVSTTGGFLVMPQEMAAGLIKAIDNKAIVRQFATVIPLTTAASLGAASLDNDPADPAWTSEIATGTEDSTMSFGKRELSPKPLAKLLKVSEKLLRLSPNVVNLVNDRLGYKFGVTEENCFLNGTGSSQPLGVFVASDSGIPTSRDVSTGNTTTSINTDGLIEALYSLKEGYIMNSRWIFHRAAIKQIRKLKDGNGQYIWQPGLASDKASTILDRPYHMSEYAPSTFTSQLYVGIIGDFSFYWICDALDIRIQRLNELYAATNQIGFIGRKETDGMPVLGEAFARVKLA